VLRRHDYQPLQVSFIGKGATLCLLYAFPLLLLGAHAEGARIVGWAFAIWGSALYWCAALLYVEQARRLLAADGASGADSPGSAGAQGNAGAPRSAGSHANADSEAARTVTPD
jgi:cardiolipin synthase